MRIMHILNYSCEEKHGARNELGCTHVYNKHPGGKMWQLDGSYSNKKEFKRFEKSHQDDLDSCSANLGRYLIELNNDKSYFTFDPGYLHREGGNLIAFGNKGGASAKECRLYAYVDIEEQVLYVLGIGGKDSQSKDIAKHKAFINDLK